MRCRHPELRHGRTHRAGNSTTPRRRRKNRGNHRPEADCHNAAARRNAAEQRRNMHRTRFIRGMPATPQKPGCQLPPYRAAEQCDGRRTCHMAGHRQQSHKSKPDVARDETWRNRCSIRSAVHPPAASPLSRQTDSGLRNDTAQRESSPRMLRRLRVLHHIGSSGQVHCLTQQRIDNAGSKAGGGNARFQRIYQRPRRAVGQHVCHGRTRQRHLREMPPSVVPAS